MADWKELCEIILKKTKARGKPVAISLFRDAVPAGYEPIQEPPCAIVHFAMDEGRKVYFDADHHDCYVGVHHAGIVPGKKEIVTGEYLSKTSSFFTEEGAARLKAGTYSLPTGMVKAIGAAPLDEVPDGVQVDWIVVVSNAHDACTLGGCRMCQDGVQPYGTFGTSLCGELFAVPWYVDNVMVVGGDFGGRMHNRLKQDQLFIIIPARFADLIPKLLLNIKVDVKTSRQMTKPPWSPFWTKKDKSVFVDTPVDPEPAAGGEEPVFTMAWDDESRALIKKVPEEMREMIVGNAEQYAKENSYAEVSMKSMREQMKALGMDLDEMMAMI
jgi:uncharacterized protein (DUF169 family)